MLDDGYPDLYQRTRTSVKKALHGLVERVGMEPAIRATTTLPVDEAQEAIVGALADNDVQVLADVDVQAIHHHYNLEYPAYRILCVGRPETDAEAIRLDPGLGAFLPPSLVVYELDGTTHVSAIRPSTLLALFTDPKIHEYIEQVEALIWTLMEDVLPESTMLSTEPPVSPGSNGRAKLKKRLNLLLKLVDAEYSFEVATARPIPEVEAALTRSLGRRGQKVLAALDVGEGIRTLLVVNPGQAHKALAIEPDVGVFAPLSVTMMRRDGRTHVRTVRPSTLLIFFDHPAMQELLLEIELLVWNGLVEAVPEGEVLSRQPPLPPGTGMRTTAAGLPGALGSVKRLLAR